MGRRRRPKAARSAAAEGGTKCRPVRPPENTKRRRRDRRRLPVTYEVPPSKTTDAILHGYKKLGSTASTRSVKELFQERCPGRMHLKSLCSSTYHVEFCIHTCQNYYEIPRSWHGTLFQLELCGTCAEHVPQILVYKYLELVSDFLDAWKL